MKMKEASMGRAIFKANLGEVDVIADGKIHRFETFSDSPGKHSGWYISFGKRGVFGDHKTGVKYKHRAGRMSKREKIELKVKRTKAVLDKSDEQELVKVMAHNMWKGAATPEYHSYLHSKSIHPHITKALNEVLLIPMYHEGELVNIQRIFANGDKRFLKGGRVKGCYCYLGNVVDRAILCEGFATGCSLHEYTGDPVIICFTAGNLMEVALRVKEELPDGQFIIAADNDSATESKTGKNPGLEMGMEAAEAIGARMIYPVFTNEDFTGSDWNDYLSRGGIIDMGVAGQETGGKPPR